MHYQKITKFDTANGPGIRTTLWVSGCNHQCKGCHNPGTWDPRSGTMFTATTLCDILNSIDSDHIRGLTISGGDPFYPDNRSMIECIAESVKASYPNKDIWVWTGYLYRQVKDLPAMKYIDVLVDGKFILAKRDITHPYHGSSNQRVIDVQKSREAKRVILYCE